MSPNSAETQTRTNSATETTCATMRAGPRTMLESADGSGLPTLARGEQRRPPEDAEQDERDDEDDRRAPVEEPRRHGEVLDPPDAVRDDARADQGRTSITASSASGVVELELEAARAGSR